MATFRSRWMRWAAIAFAILAAVLTLWFGTRSYRSLVLLRSAYNVGLPQSSSVRGWMTLRYIASTYHIPEGLLISRLGLESDTRPDSTLKSLADKARTPPLQYVQTVQRSLADSIVPAPPSSISGANGILDRLRDELLSALVKYGYPALALTLLLGAIGLPVPTGLSAAVAGSLSASGQMDWMMAIAVGMTASVLGDVAGYGLGRSVGTAFIERRGHWIGFSPSRYARIQTAFKRWGAMLILISRTLVSSLSSIVSIVAGMNCYRLSLFLACAVPGRLVWTSSYVGLGYGVGASFDAATGFLANLTGLIVSTFILIALIVIAWSHDDRPCSELGNGS